MTRATLLNYVTCEFGRKGSWMAGYHTGVDFRAPVGTSVFATRRGKVVHAGSGGSYGPAYGTYVVIQSRFGRQTIQHLYAHLSKTTVREGQKVKTGQIVGHSGITGNTFGPHLHYEERVSPFNYYSHIAPVLLPWQPKNKKFLTSILKRVGAVK